MSTRTPGQLHVSVGSDGLHLSTKHGRDLSVSEVRRVCDAWNALEDAGLTPEQVGPLVAQRDELLVAIKGYKTVLRPWLDKASGRPGTVTFEEWLTATDRLANTPLVARSPTHWMPLPDPPQGDGGER